MADNANDRTGFANTAFRSFRRLARFLGVTAALLAVPATTAMAQSVTISANPTTFNVAGDTISFSYVLNPGSYTITGINAATSAIKGVSVSCPSVGAGLEWPNTLTCTGSYQVDALDAMSGQFSDFVQMSGTRIGGAGTFSTTSNTIVVKAATGGPVIISLSSMPRPSLPGETVAVTATVSSMGCNAGQSPPGNVTISIGSQSATLALAPTAPVSSASFATFQTSTLPIGTHAVSATYTGGSGCSAGSTTGADHPVDTKPTVTINQAPAQADPTAGAPVLFDVLFDKSVTGFGASDVQLSGTAGATSASVSGSGSSYTVAVSGMTQAGSVIASIPAGSATSLAGFQNEASTSSDNTVAYVPIEITPSTLSNPVYRVAYGPVNLAASGGTAPYTFSVSAGALPAGITLSSGGVLSGTPTTSGTFNFTASVTDAGSATASRSYSLTIAAPTIVVGPSSLPNATFGAAYSQTLTATGGASPSTFAVTAGSLPGGLSLSSAGVLSGTPTAAGTFNFVATASDANGHTGSRAYTMTVSPTVPGAPVIGTGTAGDTQASVSFTAPPSTGGSAITSYTVTSNPGGITATGAASPIILTGLTNGTAYTFTVTATNIAGTGSSSAASNSVTPATSQTITFANPGSQNFGTTPTLTANASSGLTPTFTSSTPTVCTITAGGLLSFVSTGSCTINADQAGNASYLPATQVARTFTVNPIVPGAPLIGTATAGDTQASVAFTAPTSTGGSPITGYTVTSNPGGITAIGAASPVILTGLTNGTAYTFTVTATNAAGTGSSSAASNSVTPATSQTITFANPGSQNFGTTPTLTATSSSGLTPTFTSSTPSVCTITSGGDLSFVSTGSCTINANQAGNTSYLPATQVSRTFAVNPVAPIANPVSATVATGSSNNPITLNITGGAPTSAAVASAASHGVAVASGTSITYTPAAGYSGSDSFTYTATNVAGTSAAATVSITVTAPVLVLTPSSGGLTAGRVGDSYSLSFAATSGTGPYSFAVTSGTLPTGLALNTATGVLSGTPSATGAFSFTIAATDTYGATGSASYALTIAPPPAVLIFAPASGASLPAAMAGEAYSASVLATGGTGGIIYSLKSGTLPQGMILNVSTGALSGPLADDAEVKRYSFVIEARDSLGQTGEASYDLDVSARSVTVGDQTIIVPPGSAPPLVYLNRGATGGPFTGAAIRTVSPANAGKAEIIQGEVAALGSVTPVGYYLKFTPAVGFSGSVSVGYVLQSGLGTSNVAKVTFSLSHDEDTVRSEIDGLVRDFVGTRQSLLSSSIKVPGLSERRAMAAAQEPVTTRISPSNEAMTFGFSTSLAQIDAARQAAKGNAAGSVPLPFNFWIEGSLMMHRSEEDGDQWGTFAMLSAGADYMIGEQVLIGFSMHFDRMTDPTDGDAKLVGNGWLAGPYASIALADNVFLDTSLLYGGSWNDIDTTFFDGSFDTRRLLFDAELKGQWQLDENTLLVPSLRAVYLSETVDDYSVTNGSGSTIDMDGFTEEQMRMSVGAAVSRRYLLDDGVTITPKLAITSGFAGMDGEGLFGTATAGIEIGTETNWDLDLTLLYGMEGNGDQSGGAKATIRVRF